MQRRQSSPGTPGAWRPYVPSPIHLADVHPAELSSFRPGVYPPAKQRGPPPLASWIATYEAARTAGRIPEIAVATTGGVYPPSTNLSAACSWTASSCYGEEYIHDAPAGVCLDDPGPRRRRELSSSVRCRVGVRFDDGPTQASTTLYPFLKAQGVKATHFSVGESSPVRLAGPSLTSFPPRFGYPHQPCDLSARGRRRISHRCSYLVASLFVLLPLFPP